jgi:SynChlorMet cassette protein ScmD
MATSQLDKPTASPVAVLREGFGDWAVLFSLETAEVLGINPVGVLVWKLMDGRQTVEGIALEVEEHFSEVPHTIHMELTTFIDDLAERGFVEYELAGF